MSMKGQPKQKYENQDRKTVNSCLLAGHLPNAELIIYPDANHGFLFQYPHEFASEVNKFLTAAQGQ
jgi:pimeloyl-ACP methyl ester carboxylesterase